MQVISSNIFPAKLDLYVNNQPFKYQVERKKPNNLKVNKMEFPQ